jgi:hypothetical protein
MRDRIAQKWFDAGMQMVGSTNVLEAVHTSLSWQGVWHVEHFDQEGTSAQVLLTTTNHFSLPWHTSTCVA